MWGTRQAFGVFFAPVLEEFGWSRATTSAGFSATWVLTGFLSIFVGRLNDRFGPRRIMMVSGVLLGLGYTLMATLSSLWQLFLFYGIISVGMSAALVPVLSTVARWFVKRRALMSGTVLAGTGIALMGLVPLANQLAIIYGWRMSYLIIAAMTFVVLLIAAQFLKSEPSKVGGVPYGYDSANKSSPSSQVGMCFRDAIRTHQVWLLGAVYFCAYFVYYQFLVHIIIHATDQGIPASQAVLIISFWGGGGIAGRVLFGIFADRFGCKQAMVVSVGIVVLALFWLLAAKELWMLYLFGVVYGFGHGGLATMESPIVAHVYGMRSHGTLLGLVFFGDTIGGAIGPVFTGYVFDVTGSYQLAFTAVAAIGVINLILVLLIKPVKGLQTK